MTKELLVYGLVQGVGFRPFVKELALKMQLNGYVYNANGIVIIRIQGDEMALGRFAGRLFDEAPKQADITKIEQKVIEDGQEYKTFEIVFSQKSDRKYELFEIPVDIATCENCMQELFAENNRRYGHPFISCAVCGPRFSIFKEIPYDRERTVMSEFEMCDECEKEYDSVFGIRAFAQTISCKKCGPKLYFNHNEASAAKVAKALRNGRVVAIKDIGGYHFAAFASDSKAVSNLRNIKNREKKPFAVMFSNISEIKEYAYVGEKEEELLLSSQRPIVLLEKRKPFFEGVSDESRYIGAMLPSNPLQLLLLSRISPLVMTSGNLSGEPIITSDEEMYEISEQRDFDVCSNNRKILRCLDDSIQRVVCEKPQLIRRGRGFAPKLCETKGETKANILALGGDLKAAFAMAAGDKILISQHFGDLEDEKIFENYKNEIDEYLRLYDFVPEICVKDMHPGYFSGTIKINGCSLVSVQHHVAHILSVAAENRIEGDYAGFAFDGTGYGPDNAIWGGEIFMVSGKQITRKMHLKYVCVPGGDEAARNASVLAAYYLCGMGIEIPKSLLPDESECAIIKSAVKNQINTVKTSSFGRLFDVVCALLGICDYNEYEGQCACALEDMAAIGKRSVNISPFVFNGENIEFGDMLIDICSLIEKDSSDAMKANLARAFIDRIIEMIQAAAKLLNVKQISVSGGVFTNKLLMEGLLNCPLTVYANGIFPMGDGGIAAGQAEYVKGEYELCV